MDLLNQIYITCAVGGFLYLVGTAVMGFANADSGGGDSGDGGDAGGVDAGDAGGIDASDAGGIDAGGAGGIDAGDAGGIDAGDAGGIDAGDAGGIDAGDAGGIDAGDIKHIRGTGLAHAGSSHAQRRRKVNIGLLLIKLTSPYTVGCFCFFFGLFGLITLRYLPVFGIITLLPATIAGAVGYKMMTKLMNGVADKLYASSSYKEEEVIGTIGELTLPIEPGRTGELIYLRGKTRHVVPAKGKDPTAHIAKTSRVMIADIVDGVFFVEPYTDLLLDDSITIEEQKLRNS